jgi:uncharacterized membrane protein
MVWRIISLIYTILASYIITGSIEDSLTIGVADLIGKTILLFAYQFICNKIKYGEIPTEQTIVHASEPVDVPDMS